VLLFASDYRMAVRRPTSIGRPGLSADLRRKIMIDNPRATYFARPASWMG